MMARHGDMGPSSCVHQQFPANQRGVESAETGSSFLLPHTSQWSKAAPYPICCLHLQPQPRLCSPGRSRSPLTRPLPRRSLRPHCMTWADKAVRRAELKL